MKKTLLILAFISAASFCFGQSWKTILEKTWAGGSKSKSEASSDGYFYTKDRMYDVVYNESNNTFTGKMATSFNLDGKIYNSVVRVSGFFSLSTFVAIISYVSTISADQLPGGLYWTHPELRLTMYNDEDHSGYQILHGKTDGQSSGDEYVQLTNYPY